MSLVIIGSIENIVDIDISDDASYSTKSLIATSTLTDELY